MNKLTKTKASVAKNHKMSWRKFWAIIVGTFLLGFIMAPNKITEVPKEVIKEVCPQESLWRELKEIDDEGFMVASDGFFIVGDAFEALSRLDFEAAEVYIEELDREADKMKDIATERQAILKELGY